MAQRAGAPVLHVETLYSVSNTTVALQVLLGEAPEHHRIWPPPQSKTNKQKIQKLVEMQYNMPTLNLEKNFNDDSDYC